VHAEEGLGEVYVLGVRPGAQGGGLGKALTTIGLRHLAAQTLPTAMLYVDADNKAAVSVYERLGFVTHETDLMYRTNKPSGPRFTSDRIIQNGDLVIIDIGAGFNGYWGDLTRVYICGNVGPTQDMREGMSAFLEKRKAAFTGR